MAELQVAHRLAYRPSATSWAKARSAVDLRSALLQHLDGNTDCHSHEQDWEPSSRKEDPTVPTAATRVLLVVTSFAPLWLGLGILEYPGGGWAAVPLYVLAVLSPVALGTYLRAVRRIATTKETVTSANRREQELVAYVASYLVPFAFVSIDGWRPKTVLAMFLLLIIGLATHARIYYVNPLLAVAGYHVYEVVFDTGSIVTLITRRTHLPAGAKLAVRTLDNDVYLESGPK